MARFSSLRADAAAHQLQVVDDDQAELAALARLAARARAQLARRQRRALVDEEADLAELLDRLGQAPPFVVAQRAGAQVLLVDAAERADHAQGELRGAHFHREHDHRQAFVDGDVLGDVERERGLAHRRPRREHDQVARLQAGGHAVQVEEAGAHAGDFLGAVLVQLVDAVDQLHHQLVHALEALARARAFLADAEDLALGLVEDLRDRRGLAG